MISNNRHFNIQIEPITPVIINNIYPHDIFDSGLEFFYDGQLNCCSKKNIVCEKEKRPANQQDLPVQTTKSPLVINSILFRFHTISDP